MIKKKKKIMMIKINCKKWLEEELAFKKLLKINKNCRKKNMMTKSKRKKKEKFSEITIAVLYAW